MAVLFPGKFIYLATPHTATISTTTALARLPGAVPSDINEIKRIGTRHRLGRGTHHATEEEIRNQSPEHFTGTEESVSVVRNPYDLILTWWLRQRVPFSELLGRDLTFHDFLESYDERGPGPYLRDGRIFWMEPDHVLRFEHLQEDLDAFLGRHGLGPVELPRLNVTGKTGPWRDHYDADALRIVNRRFGAEIERTGYEVVEG